LSKFLGGMYTASSSPKQHYETQVEANIREVREYNMLQQTQVPICPRSPSSLPFTCWPVYSVIHVDSCCYDNHFL